MIKREIRCCFTVVKPVFVLRKISTSQGINQNFPFINPLNCNPDKNEISLDMITTFFNIQVTRIKEVITEDKVS